MNAHAPTQESARSLSPQIDLMIVERKRNWSALCEVRFSPGVVKVRECRSIQQASDRLSQAPWALIGLDVNLEPWPRLARWLLQCTALWPHMRCVLLGRARLSRTGLGGSQTDGSQSVIESSTGTPIDVELRLRAAGAVAVVHDLLEIDRLVRIVDRHAARLPRVASNWQDQLWARLPWPRSSQKSGVRDEQSN